MSEIGYIIIILFIFIACIVSFFTENIEKICTYTILTIVSIIILYAGIFQGLFATILAIITCITIVLAKWVG